MIQFPLPLPKACYNQSTLILIQLHQNQNRIIRMQPNYRVLKYQGRNPSQTVRLRLDLRLPNLQYQHLNRQVFVKRLLIYNLEVRILLLIKEILLPVQLRDPQLHHLLIRKRKASMRRRRNRERRNVTSNPAKRDAILVPVALRILAKPAPHVYVDFLGCHHQLRKDVKGMSVLL